MARITIRLDDPLHDRLRDQARRSDMTPSSYLRDLLERYEGGDPSGQARSIGEIRTNSETMIAGRIATAANGRRWLERTLSGLRDKEGGWVSAAVAAGDGSHDLGPLQVNSSWATCLAVAIYRSPDEVRQWLQYDACFDVDAARWIFLSGLAITHDYWNAIGLYHSPTGWRQHRYAQNVVLHFRRRFGPAVFQLRNLGREGQLRSGIANQGSLR